MADNILRKLEKTPSLYVFLRISCCKKHSDTHTQSLCVTTETERSAYKREIPVISERKVCVKKESVIACRNLRVLL